MPFNPTLPVNASPVSSAELRNQFNGLKDLIDALTEQVNTLQNQVNTLSGTVNEGFNDRPTFDELIPTIHANAAANVNSIDSLDQSFSTPPTPAELDAVLQRLNDLIIALHV